MEVQRQRLIVQFLVAISLGWAALSCSGGTSADSDELPEEWTRCQRAPDCKLVRRSCCEQCAEKDLAAVNYSFQSKARGRLGSSECSNPGCEQGACSTFDVQCADQACEVKPGTTCKSLGRKKCGSASDCTPITGTPLKTYCRKSGGGKATGSSFFGCRDAANLCGTAETCAFDPNSNRRAVFPDDCIPGGWQPCAGDACRSYQQP